MMLKDKSPAEIHLMAFRARETLQARIKSLTREHRDRMRKLNGLMQQIGATDYDGVQGLEGMASVSCSPELEQLVIDPTHGL